MTNTGPNSIVFVVDDEASVRRALARVLKSTGFTVETFDSAQGFLGVDHPQETAGCVVADLRMPGLSGLELQRELKVTAPWIPVIFLTGHGDIPTSVDAMKRGAADFLTKPVDDDALLRVVQQAINRSVAERAQHAELRELQRRADTLTAREREVMALVVQGLLNKQVAAELGTVEKTIKVHRARVVEKMGVESIAELVRAGEKLKLSSPRPASAAPLRTVRPSALPQRLRV